MKRYGLLTSALIAIWFAFALTASALHLFETTLQRVGIAVAIAATAPILIFALWFATSSQFRQFAFNLNPRTLTLVQSLRVLGVVFVVLEARQLLPAVFALPAGYGDMFIGATAGFVAFKLADQKHRGGFILWQILGIADLLTAVALGVTAPLISPNAPTMLPVTALPLSLVPTFLVPLFFIFHVISIAQARTWNAASTHAGEALTAGPGLAA